MSDSADARMSAREWLAVRKRVASAVHEAHSSIQEPSTVKIAEHLLEVGYIDVNAVAEALKPRPATDPETLTESESPA